MKLLNIINSLRDYLKTSARTLALAAGLAVCSAQALTYSVTGNSSNGLQEWGGEADGYRFTTGSSILVVSWLGFYDAPNGESGTEGDGLLASHRVSIWRASDGVLMAQTTVVPADTLEGNFRGNSVTPVVLAANTSYVIAADYGGEGDRMRQGNDLTGLSLNGITIQEGRYNGAGGDMPGDTYDIMLSANFGYDLAALSVSLTTPADTQAYPTGTSIPAIANVVEPGAFADTVTFHTTPIAPAGPTVDTPSADTSSPFSADLGVLPPGTYQIYATVANDNVPPDTATSATHTFTVAAAIPTATVLNPAGPATTYGDNASFTATVSPVPTGGTVQFYDGVNYLGTPVAVNTTTGEATYSTTALGAGSRVITAEYSGHWLHETSGTVTSITQEVGQAGLTVTAQNVFRFQDTANPDPLPYQITGFQNGQTLGTSGVGGTPALSTTAVPASPIGDYPITCAVGSLTADNYSFTSFVDAILTVMDPATPLAINVNFTGGTAETESALSGPAGGLGTTWNQFTGPASPGTLAHSAGPATTVTINTNFGLPGTFDTPVIALPMLRGSMTNFGKGNDGTNVTINGLEAGGIYDIWLVTLRNQPFDSGEPDGTEQYVGWWSTTNTTTSSSSQLVDARGASINTSTFVAGYNYVLFEDVVANGSGQIVFTGVAGPLLDGSNNDHRLGLNGIQIKESAPVSGFGAWADANNATGQTPDQDHDNDGVENGIEYFMGETGSSFTAMPGLDGTNTITWPMDAGYAGTYEVQTSPDLGTWTNVDPRPTPSGGNLSYTLPTGLGIRFVRLIVTPTD